MDIDDALRAGAEPIHRRMVAGAPVKAGRMKRSIKIGKVIRKTGRVITIGIHRRDFGPCISAYVEYGMVVRARQRHRLFALLYDRARKKFTQP